MSIIKRIFSNYLNGHQGGYRNTHHSGNSNSHHGQKKHYNNYSSNNESQEIRCPKCQTYNAVGARFCGQCGQEMQNKLCECGATITAGTKFCGQCGKLI